VSERGTVLAALASRWRAVLGAEAVLDDPLQRRTYECDGLAHYRAVPGLVVLPTTTEQVATVVRDCVERGVPYVARGSGTGLSGGALPASEGVLIVTSRMRSILEVDIANGRAVVEPGVVNLDVTRAAAPSGRYYAPDPSSQQVCSIGGNLAENAGGAHCLKYGFTTHHVSGAEVVTPDGAVVRLGGKAPDPPGYDLLGVLVGSEGTLGIATEITLRLLRAPEAVHTLLAGFRTMEAAGAAVASIIGDGIVPAAIELMDALAIEAAEAAVQCRYPEGAGAVLLVELDGPSVEVDATAVAVEAHLRASGTFELRVATDPAERAALWRGRKSAFAAVGRISPDYLVQDGVVPRTRLAEVLRRSAELATAADVRVANVFHAGDGNLHPLVLFDERVPGEAERAEIVAAQILRLCIEHGGSITGEHGVGVEKVDFMAEMFSEDDLAAMARVRRAFDPSGLCNPGKLLPTPRLCGERPGRGQVHPVEAAGLGEVF
jgi:glycolate oxidase